MQKTLTGFLISVLTVTAAVSAPPQFIGGARSSGPTAATTAVARFVHQRPDIRKLDQSIQRVITDLFLSYERRSTQDFRRNIGGDFRSRDGLGFGNGQGQLFLSINGDFRNLRDVNFDVVVNPPQYSSDFRSARVDVTFSRRARFAVTAQEWVVRNQRVTFVMDLGLPRARVGAIDGTTVFGMTNAMGVLIVDKGTIDGQPVSGVMPVLNGRLDYGSGDGQFPADLFSYGNLRRKATAGGNFQDLALSAAGVTFSPNPPPNHGPYTVSVRVNNIGTEASAPANLRLQIFDPNNQLVLLRQSNLASIRPSGSIIVSFAVVGSDLGAQGATGGPGYRFHAFFNPPVVEPGRDSNNDAQGNFTVAP